MPGLTAAPIKHISDADRAGVLANLENYVPPSLDLFTSGQPMSPPVSTSSATPASVSPGAPGANPHRIVTRPESKVGNDICRSCSGTTQHACVQCFYPCHQPMFDWRDTFGQEQRCSKKDPKSEEETDHICRHCAQMPAAVPKEYGEDITPGDPQGLPSDEDPPDILEEDFDATQMYAPGSPQQSLPAFSSTPSAASSNTPLANSSAAPHDLSSPFPLSATLTISKGALGNVRDRTISYGEGMLTGTMIELLPGILTAGLEKRTLTARNNETYNDPSRKKHIHSFVPFCDFDKGWGLFDALTSIGEQLGQAW